jgi:hypothetical protein
MAKLRGLVQVGLMGVLVVCAPPAQAVVVRTPGYVTSAPVSAHGRAFLLPAQSVPPGPVLDPAETDKANSQKTKNKLVAGGVAVVLLGIVVWGRRIRTKKRKKDSDKSQGK